MIPVPSSLAPRARLRMVAMVTGRWLPNVALRMSTTRTIPTSPSSSATGQDSRSDESISSTASSTFISRVSGCGGVRIADVTHSAVAARNGPLGRCIPS